MKVNHMTDEKRELIDKLNEDIRVLENKIKVHLNSLASFEKGITEKQEILNLLYGAGSTNED